MGRIKKGILGGFSGKVGTVVGSSWHGTEYMRGVPNKPSKPRTTEQLGQQSKMSLMRGPLIYLGDIVKTCFQNYRQKTANNAALSYNMLHAIVDDPDGYRINFPNLLFSKGDLLGAWSPVAVSSETETLDVSWTNGGFSPMCAASDLVTVVLFEEETENMKAFKNMTRRDAGTIKLSELKEFKGKALHCYLCFYSIDLKISSTNQYVGEVVIL
jgi:hypothetical protein